MSWDSRYSIQHDASNILHDLEAAVTSAFCKLTGGVSVTLKYKFIPKMLPAIATNATATVTMLSTCRAPNGVIVSVSPRVILSFAKLSICSCWAAACMSTE